MQITDRAFMLGQYVLVAAFGIDPAILGVQVTPVATAVMVAGVISAGGLLSSKYAQIQAMGSRMARLLKGASRNMRIPLLYASPSELAKKASPWVTIAAGIAIILFYGISGWLAHGANEGYVTLTSWMLHMGVWGCASGVFGIVWGAWKLRNRNRVSRHRSKPSNVIRKRLNRVVTPYFFAEQQVFAPPWADGARRTHKQLRPLTPHASGKSTGRNR